MKVADIDNLAKRPLIMCMLSLMVNLVLSANGSALAQQSRQVANTETIVMEIIAEPGSPVEITGARTELELDPFGLPVYGKTYIDYKNVGDKTISAVKFRIRYLNAEGESRGTFHANDNSLVMAGSPAATKFSNDRLHRNIKQAKIRVLAIKYSEGGSWESERMKDVMKSMEMGTEAPDDEKPGTSPEVKENKPSEVKTKSVVEPAPAAQSQSVVPSQAAPETQPAPQTQPAPVESPIKQETTAPPTTEAQSSPPEAAPQEQTAVPQKLKALPPQMDSGDPFNK